MLLVHDHEAELGKFNFLFQQGMRADHELRISLRDVTPDFAFAISLQRARQQDDAVSGIFQNPSR